MSKLLFHFFNGNVLLIFYFLFKSWMKSLAKFIRTLLISLAARWILLFFFNYYTICDWLLSFIRLIIGVLNLGILSLFHIRLLHLLVLLNLLLINLLIRLSLLFYIWLFWLSKLRYMWLFGFLLCWFVCTALNLIWVLLLL